MIFYSPKLNHLFSEADSLPGELNAYSQLKQHAEFVIKMHVLKGTTLSSQIEGTKITREEAHLL
jgi:hypothetical protein